MYTHAHTHCLLFFLWWLPQRGPPRYLFLLGGLVSHIEPTFLLILLPHEVHYSLVVLCIRHPVCPVIPQSQPLCFGYLKTDQSKAKRKFQTLLFLTYRFTHYLHTQSVPLLTDITIHNRTSLYIYYYIRIYSTHVYIVYKMYTKHLYIAGKRVAGPFSHSTASYVLRCLPSAAVQFHPERRLSWRWTSHDAEGSVHVCRKWISSSFVRT